MLNQIDQLKLKMKHKIEKLFLDSLCYTTAVHVAQIFYSSGDNGDNPTLILTCHQMIKGIERNLFYKIVFIFLLIFSRSCENILCFGELKILQVQF